MKNMVQYWIATSNWYNESLKNRPCSGAIDRDKLKIWWFRNGTKIVEGDRAIIYLHGTNTEADKENIKIDDKLKQSFIGYFTVDKIFISKDTKISIPDECWGDLGGWITIKDNSLYPYNRVVKRKNINDELLKEITGKTNVGLVFKDKTWIKINKEYYDLVLTALS